MATLFSRLRAACKLKIALNVRGLLFLIVGSAIGVLIARLVLGPLEDYLVLTGACIGGSFFLLAENPNRAGTAFFIGLFVGVIVGGIVLLDFSANGQQRFPQFPELWWIEASMLALRGFGVGLGIAFLVFALVVARSDARPTGGHDPRFARCASCDAPILHPGLVRTATSLLRTGQIACCPRCWRRHKRQEVLLRFPLFLFVISPGLLILISGASESSDWWLLNADLAVMFCFLLVWLHELGHALMGWLVGLRLFQVYVGHGFSIYARGTWGISFEPERADNRGGFAWIGLPDRRRFRSRWFLLVLGGPMVHLFCLVVALCFLSPTGVVEEFDRVPNQMAPAAAFVAANIFFLAVCLFPWRFRTDEGEMQTDGYQLATISFAEDEVGRQMHIAYYLMEGNECIRLHRFAEAQRWYEAGLRTYPGTAELTAGIAFIKYREGDHESARKCWQGFLQDLDTVPEVRSVATMGVIWAELLRLLNEQHTAEMRTALRDKIGVMIAELQCDERAPMDAALLFLATHGCVLVETGQVDEGTRILQWVEEQDYYDDNKAFCACYLAVAAHRSGHGSEATKHLDAARAWDSTCPFIGPVAKLLAGNERQPALP